MVPAPEGNREDNIVLNVEDNIVLNVEDSIVLNVGDSIVLNREERGRGEERIIEELSRAV